MEMEVRGMSDPTRTELGGKIRTYRGTLGEFVRLGTPCQLPTTSVQCLAAKSGAADLGPTVVALF